MKVQQIKTHTLSSSYHQNPMIAMKKQNKNYEANSNFTELSNLDSLGRSSVAFKGNNVNLNLSSMSIKDLNDLKDLYTSNQSQIEAKKKAAQANLDKIEAWDSTKEREKASSDAEKEIDNNGISRFWHPFKINRIREKHFNIYWKKYNEISELISRKSLDKEIINSSPLSESQIKILVQQIDYMIEQKKRLDGLESVQNAINSMFNKQNGLDERIAGYEYEKDQITRMFVEPLSESRRDPNVKVPSAVLLHGATGTGKTTFINGIGFQAKDFAKVVDLSPDVDSNSFEKEIKKQMEDARKRYFETGEDNEPKKTRTILLINEAEKFLSMTPEEGAQLLGENTLDKIDIECMEQYGQNANFINKFKTLLDTCSEVPKDINDSVRGPLTIFMTSNYPHLIHPDLLSRDGKMPFIAINPARNENIEAVVKHYFKKASTLVEEIKTIENPDDAKHLIGITRKAKENIKNMIEKGEINKLKVDYENIPYDKIAADFNPNPKKGAFSNDRYRKLAEDAANLYLEDPSHTFYNYFSRLLLKEDAPKKLNEKVTIPSGRDINPNRYKKFVFIYNLLAPAEPNEKEILLGQERLGSLDEKSSLRLNYIRMKEDFELNNLIEKEENGNLTEEEKTRLDELRFNDIKNAEFEDDLDSDYYEND